MMAASHRFPTSLATLPALLIALSACDRADASSGNHVDALARLVAEEEIRIGDFDDPDVGFSRVAGVDIDRDGNVYVLEGSVPEIRVYGPDGAILRRIGGRGGGPGEFEAPPRFGIFGDTVWTVDSRVNRITLFDRQGTVLSTGRTDGLAVPLPSGYGYLLPLTMRQDGKFTSHFGRIAYDRNDPPTGVRPTDSIPVPLVLFDATGAITDTIGWAGRPPPRMWRPPGEDDTRIEMVEVGDRRMMVPSPPTTLPWWGSVMDGYLLVETPLARRPEDGTFSVTRFGLSGDTAYTTALHYRPVRYSSAELDSIAARAARGEAGGMVPVSAGGSTAPVPPNVDVIARALRNAMAFPDFQLPILYPWFAQDESVWLRRWDGEDDATARWIILDPEGRPRGELELPADIRPVWSRGDTFWAVDPDEYDVPWVVRFSLRSTS